MDELLIESISVACCLSGDESMKRLRVRVASEMSVGRSVQLDRGRALNAAPWEALYYGQKGQRAETVSVEGREHALYLVLDGMVGSVAHGLGPSPTTEARLR